ncbi:MAG: trypsin-like peptidase domain-containing protein [Acidobacteriota bacterium]|nr:trypsin-like peptidase domain-containing protein [Acidobacteriota bacterium]
MSFPAPRLPTVLLGVLFAGLPLTAGGAQIELERRVSEVYRTASPAVVNITAQIQSYDWFRGQVTQEGSGSGFVYDSRGRIVTNYHVVEGADQLQVTFADGEVRDARLVGADPTNDLAVLELASGAGDPQPLTLGDSDALEVGRFVVAIGHPFGLDQTLTTGVVSGLGRVIESPDQGFIGEIIQTDAAINQGNSGGPLLDLDGRVVGVNSAIVSPTGTSAGIGYAIPATTLARVVPELIENGRYPHPHLAISVQEIPERFARAFRRSGVPAPSGGGLMIRAIARGGPADRAGLKGAGSMGRIGNIRFRYGGDYLLAVDGQAVATERELLLLLETNYRVGDEVSLRIWRDEREIDVRVQLIDRDTVMRRRRRR